MASLQGNRQIKGSAGFPPVASGIVFNVATVSDFLSAVQAANNTAANTQSGVGPPTIINMSDGTYQVPADVGLKSSNLTIQSASGNRSNCILQGDAMSASAAVGDVLHVFQGSGYLIQGVTVRQCGFDAIQIHGENGVTNVTINNCALLDTYQHLVKVSTLASQTAPMTGLVVKNCLIGYTANLAPNYYTGGVDAHYTHGAEIVGNVFQNIQSPGTTAASPSEPTVHFWRGSDSNLVHNNIFINVDRGIGFGLFGDSSSPNSIAINNMFYHSATGAPFIDVSITVEDSTGCLIGNNSIYRTDSYTNAIEYRGATSGTIIANNVVNKLIRQRDNGIATLLTNNTNAQAGWFVNPAIGNLHLASAVVGVVQSGTPLSWVTDDFDGKARPGSAPDIGAHQLT